MTLPRRSRLSLLHCNDYARCATEASTQAAAEQVCVCVCVCVRGHRARADVVVLTATMKSEGANTRATTLV